jgi:hypothetical protein
MRLIPDKYAPAAWPLAAGLLAVGMERSVVLAPLFLVPIILAALAGAAPGTLAAAAAIAVNAALLAAGTMAAGADASLWLADLLYFCALVGAAAWIAAPARPGAIRLPRTAYRLIFGGLAAGLAILPAYWAARADSALWEAVRGQAQAMIEALKAGVGDDVVQQSLLDNFVSVDSIVAMVEAVALRGAVLVGHIVFLYAAWRCALFAAAFRRPELRGRGSLRRFRIDPAFVWVASVSGAALLAGLVLKLTVLEIVAWNGLALSWLVYAAQGIGVLQHWIYRPGTPRMVAPLATILILTLLLQNGINAIVALAFAVVGVAENWLPLRAAYPSEPPTTP